jgi:transposase
LWSCGATNAQLPTTAYSVMTESYSTERWAPISGFESFYEVSTKGRVRALERTITVQTKSGAHKRSLRGYMVPQSINVPRRDGAYKRMQVKLCKNKKSHTFNVARLVASAFIENPNGLPFVLHLDDDATNNNVENLEWGDHAENVKQAADRHRYRYGQEHHAAKLNDVSRRLAWEMLRDGFSVKSVAAHFNVKYQVISDINQGKCKGFPPIKKPKQLPKGSASAQSKLNESQVIQIKKLLALGVKQRKIAQCFGVGQTTIAAINKGINWGWLQIDQLSPA